MASRDCREFAGADNERARSLRRRVLCYKPTTIVNAITAVLEYRYLDLLANHRLSTVY